MIMTTFIGKNAHKFCQLNDNFKIILTLYKTIFHNKAAAPHEIVPAAAAALRGAFLIIHSLLFKA